MPTPTAITIGTFDGVHLGHAALVARARERVGPEGRVVAMVFDPHPLTAIRPEAAPARLSTFEQRVAWLSAAGADEVERLAPTPDQLDRTPEEFAREFAARHSPAWVVEGGDFRFGKGRRGDVQVLATLGTALGFRVDVVPPLEVALSDQLIARASSSLARWLIGHGRAGDAATVLGRPYEMMGEVRRGDRRGRTIGFPTANVQTEQLLPGDGVYAAEVTLPDARVCRAAMNVGSRPTFAGVERRVEIHILDVAPDAHGAISGQPEYGWMLRVRVLAFVRDQVKFASVPDLAAQLERDIARVRAWRALAPLPSL